MNTACRTVAAVVALALTSACTTPGLARTPRPDDKDLDYIAAVEERAALQAGRVEVHWINPPTEELRGD